jgi:hypothetical protein
MPSACSSIAYTRDAAFRVIQSNEYQVDLESAGLSFVDKVEPASAGKSGFDGKTHSLAEIFGRSLQDFATGGDGCSLWMQRIQHAGDGVGIQQPIASLNHDGSRKRRLSCAVRTCDYCECWHALQAA